VATSTPENKAKLQYSFPLSLTNHDARKHHNISITEVTIVHHLIIIKEFIKQDYLLSFMI